MRADARRNHLAVLEAGARLLAERPTASMQEIADASGVGRTTVYRHFPAREDLVAALVAQVADEAARIMADVTADQRPAVDVLRRMAADYSAFGRRWRFLRSERQALMAQVHEADRAFHEWVVACQKRGELRDDVPATWIQVATRGILFAAADEADQIGHEEAGRLAGETLVSAFAPR